VIACGIAIALVHDLSPSRRIVVLVVLASGISAGGERVAWLLPVVALAATLGWARTPLLRAAVPVAVVAGVLAAWALAEPLLPEGTTVSPSAQVGSFETDTGRFTAFAVHTRAFLDRPVVGWGPGTTLSAYRATATPEEIGSAGIAWNEAHNLVIQTASQSGVVGLAALAWLVWVLARRAVRAPSSAAWVIGIVAVLTAFAMFEPFNLTVTPLLFLFAGAAAAPARAWADRKSPDAGSTDGIRDPSPPPYRPATRVAGWAIGALLLGVVALACLNAVASAYERYGAAYEDQTALRTSRSLQPWRVTAGVVLLEDRALDARSRNVPGAAEDTRHLIDELVGRSGWDPRVRPAAAEAEFLMGNIEATRAWQRAQIARFPGDAAVTPDPESATSAP
jgi:hypothetical protein